LQFTAANISMKSFNLFMTGNPFAQIGAVIIALSLQSNAISQPVNSQSGTARASVLVQPKDPANLAVHDEPFALFDGLVRELRSGGYVFFMRHGAVLPSTADIKKPGIWWSDCDTTQRLAPSAQPNARAIGDAITKQKISVAELLTSEFCRAFDTGIHLGLMAPTKNANLNDYVVQADNPTASFHSAGIRVQLSRNTQPRANRILVSHRLPDSSLHPALSSLPEGHTAIFKAEGSNRFHYITTLSPGQWQWIGKQNIPDQLPASSAPQVLQPTALQSAQLLIAPDQELKGMQLVTALRKGGYNLYMRHAQATVGQDGNLLQTPMWWENCAIQRNMSDNGREQARKVGNGIRALNIPVDTILTAQFCRTRETGHLLGLGPIEVSEDVNHQIGQRAGFDVNIARFKRLAEMPPKGSNNMIVSHTHGSPRTEERIMGGIQEAEVVVYRPDGKGSAEPVARITVPEWENLVKLADASKPATKP
jgi:phosphohistidine phosphatase SixA